MVVMSTLTTSELNQIGCLNESCYLAVMRCESDDKRPPAGVMNKA